MNMSDEHIYVEDCREKVEQLIEDSGYLLFFEKDGDIFGAGEEGRVVFAKMKNPDEEMPKGWEEEASFSADNLIKKMKGEPPQHLFSHKDLKKIKVLDQDEAIEKLSEEAKGLGTQALSKSKMHVIDLSQLFKTQDDPDKAPNFIQADED